MVKTEANTIHPAAFVNQPVAAPHQPRFAQQLPPGGNVINLRALFQHAQKLVIEFIDNASAR